MNNKDIWNKYNMPILIILILILSIIAITLNYSNSELIHEIEKLKSEKIELETKLKDIESDNDDNIDNTKACKNKVEELEYENEELVEELSNKNTQIEELERKVSNLNFENSNSGYR